MTTLIDTFDRAQAISVLGEGILRDDAVKAHMVTDNRIEQGAYFEELPDGSFYCIVGFKELTTRVQSEVIGFLVQEYPA